jgi:hypothetical protein
MRLLDNAVVKIKLSYSARQEVDALAVSKISCSAPGDAALACFKPDGFFDDNSDLKAHQYCILTRLNIPAII